MGNSVSRFMIFVIPVFFLRNGTGSVIVLTWFGIETTCTYLTRTKSVWTSTEWIVSILSRVTVPTVFVELSLHCEYCQFKITYLVI